MSRFKVSLVALGIIVVAIVSIGAFAGQASARSRAHAGRPRATSRAVPPAPVRVATLPAAKADSEWALASHVNW